ncbi:hypothetical protein AGMMS50268_21180 [Spirochaetia bacterium]|nr:hypothetical protein AGMMS50268_21180 [Spirochaetia bacterium]
MAIFGNQNKPDQPSGSQPPAGNGAGNQPTLLPKVYRAKRNCIYNGAYTVMGTQIEATEMKNPNFEEVK